MISDAPLKVARCVLDHSFAPTTVPGFPTFRGAREFAKFWCKEVFGQPCLEPVDRSFVPRAELSRSQPSRVPQSRCLVQSLLDLCRVASHSLSLGASCRAYLISAESPPTDASDRCLSTALLLRAPGRALSVSLASPALFSLPRSDRYK